MVTEVDTCVGVGLLFLASALLFFTSKKVPDGYFEEKIESSNKAVWVMVFITVGLIASFVPVFQSYKLDLTNSSDSEKLIVELSRMKYLIIGFLVLLIGLGFAYFSSKKDKNSWGALQYPQLILGMIAIFIYVGVEVSIQSNMGELLKSSDFGSLQAADVAPYISMYWGSLMIGRWTGAIPVFNLNSNTKRLLMFFIPIIAFGVVILLNTLANKDMHAMYYYILCVLY